MVRGRKKVDFRILFLACLANRVVQLYGRLVWETGPSLQHPQGGGDGGEKPRYLTVT